MRDLDVALLIQLDIKVGGTDGNTTDIKKESDLRKLTRK